MGNMFLGSEMMFDMIRNYFRVESDDFDDFGFLPLRGRKNDDLPTCIPLLERGGYMPMILQSAPQGRV